MTKISGTFELTSWNEEVYQKLKGKAKLTKASVTQKFDGDITGTGDVVWLMSYRGDGTARFVGIQQIDGKIGTKKGKMVLETSGDFDGKKVTAKWSVVKGSGSGAFEGLSGKGTFAAPMGSTATWKLEHDLS